MWSWTSGSPSHPQNASLRRSPGGDQQHLVWEDSGDTAGNVLRAGLRAHGKPCHLSNTIFTDTTG